MKIEPFERVSSYSLLIVLAALFTAPFVFMVSVALSSPQTVSQQSFTFFPREFHWSNFARVFGDPAILRYVANSLIITVGAVIGQVFVSTMVAYAFARLRAPGKNLIFVLLLATLMIPGEVTLIPTFVLFKTLGWVNTFLPIIVPNFFGGAYNIFLIRQFIQRLPMELDEAAKLDGLGHFGIYVRIIFPLLRPVVVAIAIFTFSANWGDFMGPLIYLNDPDRYPLALGVQILSATTNAGAAPDFSVVMVASFLLTLPMFVVFFLGQRYIYELDISGGSSALK